MLRRTLVPAVCAALLCAAPAAAQAPGAPTLGVRVSSCTTGADAGDRAGVFTGSMPLVAGARRMAMRFDLYERLPDHGWHRVRVGGFGDWERSDRDVAGFVFSKRVEQLEAPARYRVRVRFRWYSAAGRVVRRAHRTSRQCVEPDPRPDLRIDAVGVTPAGDGASYVVTVRNAGRSDALAPFAVSLSVDGGPPASRSLPSLAAGRSTTIALSGPPCPAGALLTATVDPDGAVDEAHEGDDARTQPCPLP